MPQPVKRQAVYDVYWRLAAERHAIFERRLRGEAPPWTADAILRRYKFCNSFRAADRVSQYLIGNVIYGEFGRELPAEDVFMRIVLFRLFSKESTWDALEAVTGGVTRATLNVSGLGDMLEELKEKQPIYTAAFMLASAPEEVYGHTVKHRNHLRLVSEMFHKDRLGLKLAKAMSLMSVYDALREYPMMGPFMAYQIAVDLNYSEHLDFDENDFTIPGPGAERGIAKVFEDVGDAKPIDLIMGMVEAQEEEFERLGLKFNGLFGRPLHAIDCQGLFCETDKYCREAFPDLKSNRQKIKAEFTPTEEPLPLAFPPKWGLELLATEIPAPNVSPRLV